MGSGNINLIGSFLGGMGLMYLISKRNVLGSRNQLLNRFQKGYQNIASDPYSYPETKEASLRVAREIMNWSRQNPQLKLSDIWMDTQQWRTMERLMRLADGRVNIQAIANTLSLG